MILLEDRVMLEVDKIKKEKKVGSIIVADDGEETLRDFLEATVVCVGKSSMTDYGVEIPTQVRIGDRVLVPSSISGKWHHGDKEFYITTERNICAIINRS